MEAGRWMMYGLNLLAGRAIVVSGLLDAGGLLSEFSKVFLRWLWASNWSSGHDYQDGIHQGAIVPRDEAEGLGAKR